MKRFAILLLSLCAIAPAAAQEKMARVGWLQWQSSGVHAEQTGNGFLQGLREGGFVEGKNLVLMRRSAEGNRKRFTAFAREMADAKVDVFFAPTKVGADAAWYASQSTPMVIATINDPVALGYVKSLARPGTQVTGVLTSNADLTGKRLALLGEMVPGLKRVGVLIDEAILETCRQELEQTEAAAQKLGITLIKVFAGNKIELDAAFERLASEKAQGVITTLVTSRTGLEVEEVELVQKYRLPMIHSWEPATRMGGLMSYGSDAADVYRRAGLYVARIPKGAKPADMAIEFPRDFRMVVNYKTAKQLGITIPQSVLVRADEVIQ